MRKNQHLRKAFLRFKRSFKTSLHGLFLKVRVLSFAGRVFH